MERKVSEIYLHCLLKPVLDDECAISQAIPVSRSPRYQQATLSVVPERQNALPKCPPSCYCSELLNLNGI
jgi:hypothetical protein